jgi:hypothetical protein
MVSQDGTLARSQVERDLRSYEDRSKRDARRIEELEEQVHEHE